MTIDEAIELHRKEATILTNGENHQIAEWLEELKDLRLVMTGILGEMLQDRPNDFKLYNIKRMIEDYTVKGEEE